MTSESMEAWDENTGVAAQVGLKYIGRDSDRHLIDSAQYSKSLAGSSRLYLMVAHYCLQGEVLKPRQVSQLRCYSAPAKEGSYDTLLVILTALSSEYPIFADVYKSALDWLIAKISGFIKDALTGQSDMSELVEVIKKQAEKSGELNTILANGLIRANDNLADLHEKLTETMPRLIEAAHPHLRQTLTPVGRSCSSIVQFPDTDHAVTYSEPEADAIRSDKDLVVGKPDNFTVLRIHALNIDTGSCRIELEGMAGQFSGKIDDIILKQPGNPYSTALNQHSSLNVRARPVTKDQELYKLYITEAQ